MPRVKSDGTVNKRRLPEARTPEAQENNMILLAYDLAEKQLREGTASSQVIAHFLKRGSLKEKREEQIMEEQRKLLTAKTEALEATKRNEELYNQVIENMKRYNGIRDDDYDEEN